MHTTVLLEELSSGIFSDPDGIYLDCTGGFGGHSAWVAEKLGPQGRLFIFDWDDRAVSHLKQRFIGDPRIEVVRAGFSEVPRFLSGRKLPQATGLMADLGISSVQLESSEIGIGFSVDAPLDMRLDSRRDTTAAEILASHDVDELADLFFHFGGERQSRRIARAIVADRDETPFERTGDLSGLCERVLGSFYRKAKIHPATRVFQALRIAVNGELEELDALLAGLPECIGFKGRAGLISFHELEDRRVKHSFLDLKRQGWKVLTKKPILPTEAEILENPRSRSAKLRVIERE